MMAKKKAKNPAAAALAKKRWAGTTKAERSEIASGLAKAAAKSMTEDQRKERARKAAISRWKKRRKPPSE